MKNNYHQNEEIEQFLKNELKEQKMYPSEHVWENIRTEIHGNASWPALTFIALFIISALTISTIYNYPPKKNFTATNNTFVKKLTNDQTALLPTINNGETLQKQMDPNNYTAKTFAVINNATNTFTHATGQAVIANDPTIINLPPIVEPNKQLINKSVLFINKSNYQSNKTTELDDSTNPKQNLNSRSNDMSPGAETNTAAKVVLRNKGKNKKALLYPETTFNDDNPTAEKYLKDFGFEAVKNKRQQSKWEMQFYLTPSISYRKLEDDKIRLNYSPVTASTSINVPVPLAPNSSSNSINNSVHHTPALGMELGAGLLYCVTPGFKLRTGLQFNIRQYYIDASQSQSYGIATIAIVQNNRLDSVNVFSTLSNTNGLNTTKIDTKLYQVSIPIGFQWDFIRGKKLGVSAGASIQPTFTLNKNVYMISTDYKYYANGAPFFRKWNLNTSVDLNITYKTGEVKWYIGPQIRYQHLPTYNDIYPIKEYRWDYGLKIGFTIPINK